MKEGSFPSPRYHLLFHTILALGIVVGIRSRKQKRFRHYENQTQDRKFFMHVYVTCDKLQCHTLVVFLLVLRRLASVLWMFSIIIKIHNIQLIHNRSMAFMLFIALNNSLAINMIQK